MQQPKPQDVRGAALEVAGWALCADAKGAGPGGCDPKDCCCHREARIAVAAYLAALAQSDAQPFGYVYSIAGSHNFCWPFEKAGITEQRPHAMFTALYTAPPRPDASGETLDKVAKAIADVKDPESIIAAATRAAFESTIRPDASGLIEAAELTIECAIGGKYEMPDGRSFWIDGQVAQEMTRRVLAALRARSADRSGE